MTVIILDWDFAHYYRRVDERYLTLDEAIGQVRGHERQNGEIKERGRVHPRKTHALKEALTDLRDNAAELHRIKRHLRKLINAGVEVPTTAGTPAPLCRSINVALYAGLGWNGATNGWVTEANEAIRV